MVREMEETSGKNIRSALLLHEWDARACEPTWKKATAAICTVYMVSATVATGRTQQIGILNKGKSLSALYRTLQAQLRSQQAAPFKSIRTSKAPRQSLKHDH